VRGVLPSKGRKNNNAAVLMISADATRPKRRRCEFTGSFHGCRTRVTCAFYVPFSDDEGLRLPDRQNGQRQIPSEDMSAKKLTEDYCEQLAIKSNFKPSLMADHCRLTLRQFERRFKEDVGTTPSDWLRKFRCRLARKLAAQGYRSKAIALELKFANTSQLCHDFRRIYGCSPQAMLEAAH